MTVSWCWRASKFPWGIKKSPIHLSIYLSIYLSLSYHHARTLRFFPGSVTPFTQVMLPDCLCMHNKHHCLLQPQHFGTKYFKLKSTPSAAEFPQITLPVYFIVSWNTYHAPALHVKPLQTFLRPDSAGRWPTPASDLGMSMIKEAWHRCARSPPDSHWAWRSRSCTAVLRPPPAPTAAAASNPPAQNVGKTLRQTLCAVNKKTN